MIGPEIWRQSQRSLKLSDLMISQLFRSLQYFGFWHKKGEAGIFSSTDFQISFTIRH